MMDTIMAATGWQSHTVRGAMSVALGKKLGLVVTSAKKRRRRAGLSDQPPGWPDPTTVLRPISPTADSEPPSAGTRPR